MPPKIDLGEALESQRKAYIDAVSILFDSLNKRIDEQTSLIHDLRTSLEFSQNEIQTLKADYATCQSQLNRYIKTAEKNEMNIKELENKHDDLEDYSRKQNIRIDRVQEDPNKNDKQTQAKVEKLIKEKLEVQNILIVAAHRIKRNNFRDSSRTIIAKISQDNNRDLVMKKRKNLKGTSIFINEDCSEGTLKVRKEL